MKNFIMLLLIMLLSGCVVIHSDPYSSIAVGGNVGTEIQQGQSVESRDPNDAEAYGLAFGCYGTAGFLIVVAVIVVLFRLVHDRESSYKEDKHY
jgi:hypothetical protein